MFVGFSDLSMGNETSQFVAKTRTRNLKLEVTAVLLTAILQVQTNVWGVSLTTLGFCRTYTLQTNGETSSSGSAEMLQVLLLHSTRLSPYWLEPELLGSVDNTVARNGTFYLHLVM